MDYPSRLAPSGVGAAFGQLRRSICKQHSGLPQWRFSAPHCLERPPSRKKKGTGSPPVRPTSTSSARRNPVATAGSEPASRRTRISLRRSAKPLSKRRARERANRGFRQAIKNRREIRRPLLHCPASSDSAVETLEPSICYGFSL